MSFPGQSSKHPSPPARPVSAGIHLSGPNAQKTALTVLCGDPRHSPLKIAKVYEKIGAFGTLFSDERLVDILTLAGPLAGVFVDCPLTVPPCVSCQLPSCPGAVHCEDVAVAYMLAISDKVRRRGARRARPVNPQSQRLWDVMQLTEVVEERLEPSYSANLAPLVTRAMTLQRRLKALVPVIDLHETQVPHALEALRLSLGLTPGIRQSYKRFEDGGEHRRAVLTALQSKGWLALAQGAEEQVLEAQAISSVETFHSFVTALVAAFHSAGMTTTRPKEYVASEGWVHLPLTECIAK
jgi:predicted nuclease with RNAse H fold